MDTAKRTQILETPNVILNPYRYAATGGGIANPDDIAGLVAWYDPSDSSTVFTTSSGSTNCSDGNNCGRIEDKKGTNHARSSTNLPIWRSSGLNGIGCLDFDGTNDAFVLDSALTETDYTCFMVLTRAASGRQAIGFGAASFYIFTWFTDNKIYSSTRAFGAMASASAYTGTGDHVLTIKDDNAGNGEMWLNGTSVASSSSITTGAMSMTNLGSRGSAYHRDEMGEVFIYDSALSTTDINSVHSYLSSKWGMTIATI